MSRLGDQIKELSREVDLLLAGHDNRRVIEEIEAAIDELEPTSTSLERALANRRVLGASPDFRFDAFGDEETKLCLRLRQRYAEMRKVWLEDPGSLRQHGLVAQFRQSSDNYCVAVVRNNAAVWNAWIQDLEQRFLVARPQLESIRNVLDYRDAIARYKQGAERFSVLARAIPDDIFVKLFLGLLHQALVHVTHEQSITSHPLPYSRSADKVQGFASTR